MAATSHVDRRRRILGVGVLVVVLAALVFFTERAIGDDDSPPQIKPLLSGLLWRDGPPPPEVVSSVHDYVLSVSWASLQPTSGGPLVTDDLDAEIAEAAAGGHRVKLRVLAGTSAPQWAKAIGGAPVTYYEPTDGSTGTIGRFWLPAFGAAYKCAAGTAMNPGKQCGVW